MNERRIASESQILFGSPANPMHEVRVDAIRQVLMQVDGIHEAYLPQCFIPGNEEASQALVLGMKKGFDVREVMEDLGPKLQMLFSEGQYMDILPFRHGSIPPKAKQIVCLQPDENREKKWWEIWKH